MKLTRKNIKIIKKDVCAVAAVDVVPCKYTRTKNDELVPVIEGGEEE